ncbi:MAG: TIGR03557 family F420-dependent LLM class oxidoreductase, partial [Gaiellaceae bacterium]
EIGYAISSEEHLPNDIVRHAQLAEEAGFTYALISDHFHPWVDAQGHSPFVWSTLGGIAQATEKIRVGTGVTCPMIRIHPAIVAQAVATVAAMMPGRFFLGVGSGENLNEHITGARWPLPDERLEMMEEAIEVMRLLWQGGEQTHRGKHYTVDHARVYTLPDEAPEIYVAAAAPKAAELAGRLGDGFISTAPEKEFVEKFAEAGGDGKPKLGMMHCAYDADEKAALERATKLWPNLALKGPLGQELATPSDFEAAAEMVEEEDVAEATPCGPDPERYLEMIRKYDDAGFTHVYIHQIGENQDEFAEFARRELMPKL